MAEEITSEETPKKGFDIKSLGVGAWIGIAVVALIIGVVIGHFAMGGAAGGGAALNKVSLTESELDTAVATYTANGSSQSVTAREVIEQNSSLESAADEDGNYAVPSADTILSVVRNRIIAAAAESEGITVSDEDLTAYAEETLGSSDFESIATSYSMDEETVKELLKQSAQMSKLREKVVGSDSSEAPEAPTAPEVKTTDDDGNELSEEDASAAQEAAYNENKAEYAEYIIALAGDEWDAEAGTWAADDGPYATALADYEVTKDGASYNAAEAAYYVAYQDYSTAQSEISSAWTDYVNGLLSNSSISISTLMA